METLINSTGKIGQFDFKIRLLKTSTMSWWVSYLIAPDEESYFKLLGLDSWHGGVTYEDIDSLTVGCDYAHFFDVEQEYTGQDVLRDLESVVQEFNNLPAEVLALPASHPGEPQWWAASIAKLNKALNGMTHEEKMSLLLGVTNQLMEDEGN